MAEISYIWDGTVTGDATEAPYGKDPFNTFMMLSSTTDQTLNDLYVVPSYLDDLRIYSDETGMYVNILSGAAIMGNRYIYVSDTNETLNIDSIQVAGYFRYDFIVLRLDTVAQTTRLAVVKGTETNSSATLAEPTLTQNEFTREIALARLYIDDSVSYVQDAFIVDLRTFATNYFTTNTYKLLKRNLVVNSEFMAFSSSDGLTPPEGWDQDSTAVALTATATTRPTEMSRGQAVSFGSAGEQTLRQIIPIDSSTKTFTVKGIFTDVTGGSAANMISLYPCTIDGTILNDTFKSQKYTNLIAATKIEFQFNITMDDNSLFEAVLLEVRNFDGTVNLGQVIVVTGYHPGPFRECFETILFRERLTNASWSDTAKSTGTTLVDLTVFPVRNRTKGVFVRLRGRDSASAAGVASIQVQGYAAPYNTVYGRIELDGITNDVYRESQFYVPVDIPIYAAQDETPQLRVGIVATGAGTFDATMEVVGIVI